MLLKEGASIKMIVRQIKPEEFKRTAELSAHAFEYRMSDTEKTSLEMIEDMRNNAQSTEELHWEGWAAFLDDDATMMSRFATIPYHMHFDGHDTVMIGIGGVSTLPQYRRCGGVRGCFEAALPDMYAKGAVFSYLYPFSTAFYRKFGYELGCERYRYTLKLAGMPKGRADGGCDLLEPGKAGDFKQAIRAIDAIWQQRYNCMVIEDEVDYRWIDRANPFREAEYTYLYTSAAGEPKGYMTYKSDKPSARVECSRFVFTDREGFYGLMNLLHTLASDRAYVTLCLPVDLDMGALLPEWSQGVVECVREQSGMVRVVNVAETLKMARMRGTGELIISVTDQQIAPNNGRFHVRFENGVTMDVTRTEAPCDIELTVQEFARLICGRSDLRAAAYLPDVRLHSEIEKAERVFYKKPMYISRHF